MNDGRTTFAWRVAHRGSEGVQLLLIGVLLDWLIFGSHEIVLWGRLVILAILLVGVARSMGWLLLLIIQISLFVRDPAVTISQLSNLSIVYSFVVLALIAYTLRGVVLRERINETIANTVLQFSRQPASATRSSLECPLQPWRIAKQLMGLVTVMLCATFLLIRLPLDLRAVDAWFQRSMTDGKLVWPGANLLAFMLLTLIVIREIAWRQMTSAQARIAVRSALICDIYRDLRMMIIRQIRVRAATQHVSDVSPVASPSEKDRETISH